MRDSQHRPGSLSLGDYVRLRTGRHKNRTGRVINPLNEHKGYWVKLDMLGPNDTPPITLVQPEDVEVFGEPPAPETGGMSWDELKKLEKETRRQKKLQRRRNRS